MPTTALPADVIARIDRLEIDARQVVEGHLAGRHESPRHGFAVEFAQHREYAPGDDTRHIDWKVYARTERYHLKQFEQETNLVAWLIVDQSESMNVGTHSKADGTVTTKYDVAATLAAALAYLITQQTDAVGLATIAERGRISLKSSATGGQFRDVLRLLAVDPTPATAATGLALFELSGLLGRRGVVFIFSDFLDDVDDLAAGLRAIRARKHEVVVFQVLDPAELEFPFRHPTLFHGLEGTPDVSTDPLSVRDNYLAEFAKHQSAVETACRGLEVDFIQIRTDADCGAELAAYLRKRKRR